IDVEDVGERLKGIEGDADREDEAEGLRARDEAKPAEEEAEALEEEVEVLEGCEDSEVAGDADPEPPAARGLVLRPGDAEADDVVEQDGRDQECQEAPVPPAVEEEAEGEEEEVLGARLAMEQRRQEDDQRQAQEK